jgi:hypothetical protein
MGRHLFLVILAVVVAANVLTGCKEGADAFFSGRPSEMSMVHNRIIAGGPETMLALLQVPARFPEATEAQISLWQGSVIAWWRHPEKRNTLVESFGKLSANELHALKQWVRVRDKLQTPANAATLLEIEERLASCVSPPSCSVE